jgi:NAD(P)H-hydrate epimerase
MQAIDRITIEEFGIPGIILMENAGFEIVNRFEIDYHPGKNDPIAVLCGGGNNGGDGFVVARHLVRRAYNARVFLFTDISKLRGDALFNFNLLPLYGIEVHDLSNERNFEHLKYMVDRSRYVFDALLGIGFHGTPRGLIKRAIEYTLQLPATVVSIDIPAGVDADGGQSDPLAIHADATYTVGSLKYGLVDFPGKREAGRIEVLDIGFPPAAVRKAAKPATFIDKPCVKRLIPPRTSDSHKGSYGHLAVMGGRKGMEGASLLATRAGLRCGSGLVTIFLPRGSSVQKRDEVIASYLETELENLPDTIELDELFTRQNALVIGPGLGVSTQMCRLVEKALGLEKKVLVDADGLNCLSQNPDIIKKHLCDLVLTPHIGEMSRLTGMKKDEIKNNKVSVAREFARQNAVTLVLKDAVTVVATAEGSIYINDGGVAGMSKGGSGDVLSGIVGSLMARGLGIEQAAIAGVYIHTECGRAAQRLKGADSVTAGDLIEMIPAVFSGLQSS